MSKKSLFKLLKISSFSLFVFALFFSTSFAQSAVKIPTFNDVGGMITNFDKNIVQNSVGLLSGAALVVFLAGLVKFLYDRAKGNEKDLKRDKEGILWSLGALFILVTLWGIIVWAQDILGVTKDNNINIPKICVGGNCGGSPSGTPDPSGGVVGGGSTSSSTAGDFIPKLDLKGQYTIDSIRSWDYNKFTSSSEASEDVAGLQRFLKDRVGAQIVIDGKFGDSTEQAVKSFQRNNKLKEDGIVGPSTKAVILYNYMEASPDSNAFMKNWNEMSINSGSSKDVVRKLQEALNEYGCYNLNTNNSEDGIFGSATQAAVKNFQTINALKVDGIVGPSTRAVFMSSETYNCQG